MGIQQEGCEIFHTARKRMLGMFGSRGLGMFRALIEVVLDHVYVLMTDL